MYMILRAFASRLALTLVAFTVLALLLLAACQPVQPITPTPLGAASSVETPDAIVTPDVPATEVPATDVVVTDVATSSLALVGTWRSTVVAEDILRVEPDFLKEYLCDNTGTFTWQFKADGAFVIDQSPLPECPNVENTPIEDQWVNDGNLVTFAQGTPDEEVYEWQVDGDLLTFVHKSGECIPCRAINTANPWQRVEE